MEKVRAKKHLGQHFLKDLSIAQDIAGALSGKGYRKALEIGPGMGVLTQFLIKDDRFELSVVELDRDSVAYLVAHYPELTPRILSADFLRLDIRNLFNEPFAIVGNFPYNISSQIVFKMLENRDQVPELVGMFQKEVAERFNAKPRSKAYGILTVLLQAFYSCEYLFTVHEHVFDPPPKVKSGVIRLTRNQTAKLDCDERLFTDVVKTAFNQRRKTLRNSLHKFNVFGTDERLDDFTKLRPEELTVERFVVLTQIIEQLLQQQKE